MVGTTLVPKGFTMLFQGIVEGILSFIYKVARVCTFIYAALREWYWYYKYEISYGLFRCTGELIRMYIFEWGIVNTYQWLKFKHTQKIFWWYEENKLTSKLLVYNWTVEIMRYAVALFGINSAEIYEESFVESWEE